MTAAWVIMITHLEQARYDLSLITDQTIPEWVDGAIYGTVIIVSSWTIKLQPNKHILTFFACVLRAVLELHRGEPPSDPLISLFVIRRKQPRSVPLISLFVIRRKQPRSILRLFSWQVQIVYQREIMPIEPDPRTFVSMWICFVPCLAIRGFRYATTVNASGLLGFSCTGKDSNLSILHCHAHRAVQCTCSAFFGCTISILGFPGCPSQVFDAIVVTNTIDVINCVLTQRPGWSKSLHDELVHVPSKCFAVTGLDRYWSIRWTLPTIAFDTTAIRNWMSIHDLPHFVFEIVFVGVYVPHSCTIDSWPISSQHTSKTSCIEAIRSDRFVYGIALRPALAKIDFHWTRVSPVQSRFAVEHLF